MSHCPKEFPARYFWYGGKRKGTGELLRWVEELLSGHEEGDTSHPEPFDTDDTDTMPVEDTEMNESDVESEKEALGPSGSSIDRQGRALLHTNYAGYIMLRIKHVMIGYIYLESYLCQAKFFSIHSIPYFSP